MQKSSEHNANTTETDESEARKTWVVPSTERRGSVAELVQACKISGGNDSSGKARAEGPACGPGQD